MRSYRDYEDMEEDENVIPENNVKITYNLKDAITKLNKMSSSNVNYHEFVSNYSVAEAFNSYFASCSVCSLPLFQKEGIDNVTDENMMVVGECNHLAHKWCIKSNNGRSLFDCNRCNNETPCKIMYSKAVNPVIIHSLIEDTIQNVFSTDLEIVSSLSKEEKGILKGLKLENVEEIESFKNAMMEFLLPDSTPSYINRPHVEQLSNISNNEKNALNNSTNINPKSLMSNTSQTYTLESLQGCRTYDSTYNDTFTSPSLTDCDVRIAILPKEKHLETQTESESASDSKLVPVDVVPVGRLKEKETDNEYTIFLTHSNYKPHNTTDPRTSLGVMVTEEDTELRSLFPFQKYNPASQLKNHRPSLTIPFSELSLPCWLMFAQHLYTKTAHVVAKFNDLKEEMKKSGDIETLNELRKQVMLLENEIDKLNKEKMVSHNYKEKLKQELQHTNKEIASTNKRINEVKSDMKVMFESLIDKPLDCSVWRVDSKTNRDEYSQIKFQPVESDSEKNIRMLKEYNHNKNNSLLSQTPQEHTNNSTLFNNTSQITNTTTTSTTSQSNSNTNNNKNPSNKDSNVHDLYHALVYQLIRHSLLQTLNEGNLTRSQTSSTNHVNSLIFSLPPPLKKPVDTGLLVPIVFSTIETEFQSLQNQHLTNENNMEVHHNLSKPCVSDNNSNNNTIFDSECTIFSNNNELNKKPISSSVYNLDRYQLQLSLLARQPRQPVSLVEAQKAIANANQKFISLLQQCELWSDRLKQTCKKNSAKQRNIHEKQQKEEQLEKKRDTLMLKYKCQNLEKDNTRLQNKKNELVIDIAEELCERIDNMDDESAEALLNKLLKKKQAIKLERERRMKIKNSHQNPNNINSSQIQNETSTNIRHYTPLDKYTSGAKTTDSQLTSNKLNQMCLSDTSNKTKNELGNNQLSVNSTDIQFDHNISSIRKETNTIKNKVSINPFSITLNNNYQSNNKSHVSKTTIDKQQKIVNKNNNLNTQPKDNNLNILTMDNDYSNLMADTNLLFSGNTNTKPVSARLGTKKKGNLGSLSSAISNHFNHTIQHPNRKK